MQVKVQVVTITDEGQEITQDIACMAGKRRISVQEIMARFSPQAYVEGFVHCFEVFSEMLREGKIKL
jgi:hypothetical protein